MSHSERGELKESHRLIDYWPTLQNLQNEIMVYDVSLHKLDADLQKADKFWVERLFRKKDLFYALLQKFVSQCGRLLRCEITEVDWGNVPVFAQLIRFFLIDMNNQSAAEYTALFLNTTKVWSFSLFLFGKKERILVVNMTNAIFSSSLLDLGVVWSVGFFIHHLFIWGNLRSSNCCHCWCYSGLLF